MGFAVATKVKLEQRTMSPGQTPSVRRPRWIAAVPDDVAQQYIGVGLAESCAANSRSKASTCGPRGAIQFVRNASSTKWRSAPERCGGESRIGVFVSVVMFVMGVMDIMERVLMPMKARGDPKRRLALRFMREKPNSPKPYRQFSRRFKISDPKSMSQAMIGT
jgi:hypothetical protein